MMRHLYWILTLLLLPISAYAQNLSYSYAELNYIVDEDLDLTVTGLGSVDDDDDGWNFNASFAINDTFFINGSYSDVDFGSFAGSGVDVDLNRLSVGIGGRNRVSEGVDAYGVLSYEDFELDISGAGDSDEDGFAVAGGLRGMLSDTVELNGELKYADIDDVDGWGFKLGGLFAFAPNWAVNADYSSSELDGGGVDIEIDEVRIGLRYIF